MKPGQVLEVKTYLRKRAPSAFVCLSAAQMERENPIPSSPVAAPVSAAARPPPSALRPTAAVFMPSTAVPKPEPQLLPQAREARVKRPAPTAENPPLESPNITLIPPSMFEQHHAKAGHDHHNHYAVNEPHTSFENQGSIYLAHRSGKPYPESGLCCRCVNHR